MRLKISGLCALALIGLVVGVTFAAKGGNGGGKPGGGEPPADPAIVFAKDGDLHVMNDDGSNVAGLVADADSHGSEQSWSPDGTRIAFGHRSDGIYVVNADGTGLSRILEFASITSVAWSPGETADGNEKIAFTSSYPGDLYVVNLDGTGLTNLTNSTGHSESTPSWSPEADRIVVRQGQSDPDIVVHELDVVDGSIAIVASTILTDAGPLAGAGAGLPKWAKTQDLIAVSRAGLSGDWEIWLIPVSSPTSAYVAFDGEWALAVSWSPDDSQILFQGGDGKRRDALKVVTLSSGSVSTLYSTRGNISSADWRR
ncbi:MAG: TolB family protein [Planctomycetota bacterium]|jgi:Tol biopolymer transport system component